MPECVGCGSFVSAHWKRVFAVDGEVRACPADDCGGKHISDVRVLGGGEHSTASRATQSGRIGGGR